MRSLLRGADAVCAKIAAPAQSSVGAIALQSFIRKTAHPSAMRIAGARRKSPEEERVNNFDTAGEHA